MAHSTFADSKVKSKQAPAAPALHTWLPLFLSTQYFRKCPLHPLVMKSKCHIFCIDCQGPALCKECAAQEHSGHNVLPVRKVSRKLAIVSSELRAAAPGLLVGDVVQTFNCNGLHHTFLSPRFQDHASPNVTVIPLNGRRDFCPNTCNVPLEHCSLNCKVVRQGLLSLGSPLPRLQLQPVVAVDSGVGEEKPLRDQVKKEKAEAPDCAVGGASRPPRRPRRYPRALAIRDNCEQRNTKPRSATAVTGKVREARDDDENGSLGNPELWPKEADGDGNVPFDLSKLGISKRRRSSSRNVARSSGGANGAANVDAAAAGTGPGTGGGTGAAGGEKQVKPEPDPRGFSMPVVAGVENREFKVARKICDGLNTWFATKALLDMSQSKEKWDPPRNVANPIERAILERCYRRQLEKRREVREREKEEAATGGPAPREEA